MNTNFQLTEELAKKVLDTVDAGLCKGLGKPIAGQMCVEAAVCYAMGLPHGDEPTCVSPAVRSLKITLNDANWGSKAARAKGMRRLAIIQLGSMDTIDDADFTKRVSEMVIRKVVPRALRNAALLQDEINKKALEDAAIQCEQEGTESAKSAAWSAAWSAESAAWSAKSAAWSAAWSAKSAARSARSAAESAESEVWSAAESAARSAWSAESAARSAWSAESAARSAAYDTELEFFAEEVVKILINMDAPATKYLRLTEV